MQSANSVTPASAKDILLQDEGVRKAAAELSKFMADGRQSPKEPASAEYSAVQDKVIDAVAAALKAQGVTDAPTSADIRNSKQIGLADIPNQTALKLEMDIVEEAAITGLRTRAANTPKPAISDDELLRKR